MGIRHARLTRLAPEPPRAKWTRRLAPATPCDSNVSTTETTTRATGELLPALLAGVVVALVLGIVGMHTEHPRRAEQHRPRRHADARQPRHPRIQRNDETHAGVAGSPAAISVGPEGGTGHGLGHMVLLCVAMLAVAAGTLLALRSLTRRAPRAVGSPAPRIQRTTTRLAHTHRYRSTAGVGVLRHQVLTGSTPLCLRALNVRVARAAAPDPHPT